MEMEQRDYTKMKRVERTFENMDKWSYNDDAYESIIGQQKRNPHPFAEQVIGGRRKLYKNGKFICSNNLDNAIDLGGIKKSQFAPFLGMFYKSLYGQFAVNPNLYDKKIDFIGKVSKDKNFKSWESLSEDDWFWNVDLKSAYWQVCYRLGYIDSKLYFKYSDQEEYKKAKRYCVSFLARKNKMIYNYPTLGLSYEISCDIDVLERVYSNIRNELYNCIAYAMEELCLENSWLEYNIDGVSVIGQENVNMVKRKFKEMGLDFKSSLCIKIDQYDYKQGSKVKAFTKRPSDIIKVNV